MPIYDTDSQVKMTFTVDFFAEDADDAADQLDKLLKRLFPAATIGLFKQAAPTVTALSGQDITGNNYLYTLTLHVKQGDSTVTSDSPDYVAFSADTPADALATLKANAQRITNIAHCPVKVLYLQEQ